MKWYKNVYRRQLVDMHINDDKPYLLKKFSAEKYFSNLKLAKIQSPMIYLQSHTGLCNFPTSVAKEHEFFKKNPNELKKLIDLCHNDNMKVVGYYSLIFNNVAVKLHPEWEMINADNTTWRDHGQRYGLCCPNNKEYREFVTAQIKEIAKCNFNLDGIFYDMPYWEMLCHCPSCKEVWEKEVGGEMPLEKDFNDERWNKYVRLRQKEMVDFVKFVKEKTNEIMPNVTVEFNFAAVIGCDYLAGSTEGINDYSEFTGGDLYGDLYNHSFTCKYYYNITKNQPFEYMTCRCNKTLREHTVTKPKEMILSEVMLTAIHHGATLNIDAINPDGTMDKRVYEKLGKVFSEQLIYEKYMDKGELYSLVAVYFDSTTQFKKSDAPTNKECAINTVRTLIENHVPVSVIANHNLENLEKYQMIIAPSLYSYCNPEIENFISYVKNGGTLYLSGESDDRLLKEFFDGKIVDRTFSDKRYKRVFKGYDEVQAYVTPISKEYKKVMGEFNKKYPMPIVYKLPIIELNKGEIEAKIVLPYTNPDNNKTFVSIHSNPPYKTTKFPAIVTVNYGKGKVIWSASSLENDLRVNYQNVFMNIVNRNIKKEFNVKTSKYVECVTFKDKNDYYIGLIDLNFYNEIIKRDFEINYNLKGKYVLKNLTNGKEQEVDKKIKGSFKKYVFLKLEFKE